MSSDRNLLFGILALQLDFITRDALIKGMNAWVLEKSKSIGSILQEQGALRQDAHDLLNALVDKHLEKHDHDVDKSLASLSSLGNDLQVQLHQIADPDLQASLARVAQHTSASEELERTRSLRTAPATPGSRFRILRPHARGGLGQVYVAHDEELHRQVALKEIQTQHADRPESRSRFLLEAEITGGLEHPGIVPVYGLGQYADGRPFYAMRFIRGDSLKTALEAFHAQERTGRDPGERSLALRKLLGRFIDVCNAIDYAHARGVLHRDLKPGNIMLGAYGETLVVDWGLAKPMESREDTRSSSALSPLRPSAADSPTLTFTGQAIGTPAYMSPEQASGRMHLLGPASDVYSLGATLYALLTGKAPPTDGSRPPPPRHIKPDIHPALEAICLKAMARESKDRYAAARELADDLEHWLADEPVSAWPEPWSVRAGRWTRRHRPLVTGLAVALVMAVAALAVTRFLITQKEKERALEQEKAREETRRAEREVYTSRRMAEVLSGRSEDPLGLDGISLPMSPEGKKRTYIDILKSGEKIAELKLGDDGIRAAVLSTIGNGYRTVGMYDKAHDCLNKAYELRKKQPNELALADSLHDLGLLHLERGHYEEGDYEKARDYYDKARLIREKRDDPALCDTLFNLAGLESALEHFDEAQKLLEEVVNKRTQLESGSGKPSLDLLRASLSVQALKGERAGPNGFIKALPDMLLPARILVNVEGNDKLIQALNHFVSAITNTFEAEKMLRDMRPGARESFVTAVNDFRACQVLLRDALGEDHFYSAVVLLFLADSLGNAQQYREAEMCFQDCFRIIRLTVGYGHDKMPFVAQRYARLLRQMNKHKEARAFFEEILAGQEKRFGRNHFKIANAKLVYAETLEDWGDHKGQEQVAREALAIYDKTGLTTWARYGDCFECLKRAREAQKK